jgi:hypothetical protein
VRYVFAGYSVAPRRGQYQLAFFIPQRYRQPVYLRLDTGFNVPGAFAKSPQFVC